LDIFEALEQIDLKQFGQPYYLVDLISEMLQNRSSSVDNEQLDRAINLLEKVSDAFPEYRNQVYSQLYRPELWKNPRIFELAKKALLPSASEMAANPWFGVGQIYSYGSNGRVTSQ